MPETPPIRASLPVARFEPTDVDPVFAARRRTCRCRRTSALRQARSDCLPSRTAANSRYTDDSHHGTRAEGCLLGINSGCLTRRQTAECKLARGSQRESSCQAPNPAGARRATLEKLRPSPAGLLGVGRHAGPIIRAERRHGQQVRAAAQIAHRVVGPRVPDRHGIGHLVAPDFDLGLVVLHDLGLRGNEFAILARDREATNLLMSNGLSSPAT